MLTINEIFHSIQGESTFAGRPCVFVRLTACDLRCRWCDTPYAFHEGRKMSVEAVVADVEARGCALVEVTGGEPLLQPDVYPLMRQLIDSGKTVLIETGGHRSIDQVDRLIGTVALVGRDGIIITVYRGGQKALRRILKKQRFKRAA